MKTLLVTIPSKYIDHIATGRNVRHDRRRRHLTLGQVARFMEISTSYLCDLEMGRRHWTEELVARYQEAVK